MNPKIINRFLRGLTMQEKSTLQQTLAQQPQGPVALRLLDYIESSTSFDLNIVSEHLGSDPQNVCKIWEEVYQSALRSVQFHQFNPRSLDTLIASAKTLRQRGEFELLLELTAEGKRLAWEKEDWRALNDFLDWDKEADPHNRTGWQSEKMKLDAVLEEIEHLKGIRRRFHNSIAAKNTGDSGFLVFGLERDIGNLSEPQTKEAEAWTLKLQRLLATFNEEYQAAGQLADLFVDHIYAHTFLLRRFEKDLLVELNTAASCQLKLYNFELANRKFYRLRTARMVTPGAEVSRLERFCSSQIAFAMDSGHEDFGKAAIWCLKSELNTFQEQLEPARFRLLIYFAAKFSFFMEEYEEALAYLDYIDFSVRLDKTELVGNAYLMKILLKMELGADDLQSELEASHAYFAAYMEDQQIPRLVFSFLQNWQEAGEEERSALLKEAREGIAVLSRDPALARADRMLNGALVLESMERKVPVMEIIHEKETVQKQKGALG